MPASPGRVVVDAAVDHIDPRVGAVGWHDAVRERVGRVVQQLVIAGEFDADLAVAGRRCTTMCNHVPALEA